jgi:hypothetical protein
VWLCGRTDKSGVLHQKARTPGEPLRNPTPRGRGNPARAQQHPAPRLT